MNLLDNLIGAALIGIIFNAWLVGLVCTQTYSYYIRFPEDRKVLKALVAWIVTIQVFNLIIDTVMIYHYLVSSFGVYLSLLSANWEWSLYLGLISIAACGVQIFYAGRILKLNERKNYWIPAIISLLSLGGLGLCLSAMFLALTSFKFFSDLAGLSWLITSWLCLEGACDLLIAVVQVYYLHRSVRGLSAPKTRRFVNMLNLYFISTCLLTSILVVVELVLFAALGFNFVHVLLSYSMGAFHALSFLANLHARSGSKELDEQDASSFDGALQFSSEESRHSTGLGLE